MKFTTLQAVLGSAMVLASIPECGASSAHRRLHDRLHHLGKLHSHHHQNPSSRPDRQLARRAAQCAFPTDEADLVAVTPSASNAGWAMSPDQPCKPGNYCPYACKSGMVMAQWDPHSTYTYPDSMNGGLFCDKDGNMQKPFPDKPLCVDGTGSVKAVNKCSSGMSWCQTVLPGNEAMLIPTDVSSIATLAVPDISYWQGTAAHFYVNPPGSGSSDCKWGDDSQPIGNWSPYVAGANTDASGNTFVKIGMNPIYQNSDLASTKPSFGIRIECEGCQGLPCEIKPGTASVSGGGTEGAGGAAFCVVTVPKGGSANIVTYDDGGDSSSDSSSDSTSDSSSATTSAPKATKTGMHAAAFADRPEETTSAPPTTTQASKSTTSSAASSSSSTSHAKSKSTSTSKSESTSTSTSTSTSADSTTTNAPATTDSSSSSSESSTTMGTRTPGTAARPTVRPGIFHENSTAAATTVPSKSEPAVAPALTHKAEAIRHSGGGAFAGLIIAFIATACLF